MSANQEKKAPKAILYNKNIAQEVGLAVFARNVVGKKNVDVCALDKKLVLSKEKAKEEFAQHKEIFAIGTYWPWLECLRENGVRVTIIDGWDRKELEKTLIPENIRSSPAYKSFCFAHHQILKSIFDRKKDCASTEIFFSGLYNQDTSVYFVFDDVFDDFREKDIYFSPTHDFYEDVCKEGQISLRTTRNLAKNRVQRDGNMKMIKTVSGIFYAVCDGNDLINLMHESMKEHASEFYDQKIHCSIVHNTTFGDSIDDTILNVSIRSHDVKSVNAPEIARVMQNKHPEKFVSGGGPNAFSAGATLKCNIEEFLNNLP